jgi:BolA protein
MTRIERIRAALAQQFPEAEITLTDESHLHAGHAGAATGRGHYRLAIASPQFTALPLLARHRAVYAALGDLMQTEIHALAIEARPL